MTADDFRALALSFPETLEAAHMNHPDFRVRGKIFATLGYPTAEWGVVMFTPREQKHFVDGHPDVFVPVGGTWGKRGATSVRLRPARKGVMRQALKCAWSNKAPKTLARQLDTPVDGLS
jgi:hypothetical protein